MKNFITIMVLIILAGGGYWFYQRSASESAETPTPAQEPAEETTSSQTPAPVGSQTHTISMDASGFTPSSLTIKTGDTVVFTNNDRRERWPASGMHPTHQLCPGFDSLKPMASGETYSHTFTQTQECPMHDHLIPSLRGKITITE